MRSNTSSLDWPPPTRRAKDRITCSRLQLSGERDLGVYKELHTSCQRSTAAFSMTSTPLATAVGDTSPRAQARATKAGVK